jgi:hypothetical protein
LKCPHGKRKSNCRDCGGSSICEHNKNKYICRDCGASIFCAHGRQKNRCRDCSGSAFCEHDKIKSYCRECGGSFCEHNKRKTHCKECGGSAICEHLRFKSTCKECGGSGICEHNKLKRYCKDCGGSGICEHNKTKTHCKDCGGSAYCEHKIQKNQCKYCSDTAFCEHNKLKRRCETCGGSEFCEHKKRKTHCKECGGSGLCKSTWCETFIGNKKYEGYCLRCFVNLFPDKPNTRNYKTKEKCVVDNIIESFPQFTWVADKKVQDGCSKRRPDLLLDLGSHIIIVEVDENKHTDYDCSCEHKRLMELSQDLHHRPIVFIRFNPDDYTTQDNTLVKSCWKVNKLGVMQIMKTKESEWKERMECLKQQIQYWIDNQTEKTVEIVELFY